MVRFDVPTLLLSLVLSALAYVTYHFLSLLCGREDGTYEGDTDDDGTYDGKVSSFSLCLFFGFALPACVFQLRVCLHRSTAGNVHVSRWGVVHR